MTYFSNISISRSARNLLLMATLATVALLLPLKQGTAMDIRTPSHLSAD